MLAAMPWGAVQARDGGLPAYSVSMGDIALRVNRSLPIGIIGICIAIIGAVCLHSVEEIHYLKTFFPRTFTVEEAFYASGIELVKVLIISIPLSLVVALCIVYLWMRQWSKPEDRESE